MEDNAIIDLYWQRSEHAIAQTDQKYGRLCFSIACNILDNREDAEESVNDTYLTAWEQIPPNRPARLSAFLSKITRNISISRWRSKNAAKRGGGEIVIALEELNACVADRQNIESQQIYQEAVAALRQFLNTLPKEERDVFLRRYFLLDSIAAIAGDFGFTQSKIKSMLHRTRQKLRDQFEKEDLL